MEYKRAQVIEVDSKSNPKRVKFHFWRLSNDQNEWVDVKSPRIAPSVSTSCFSYRF